MECIDALPETIGRYFVVRELGRGGMGTVYQAYDDQLERAVAIKVLPIRNAEALARFRREAELLARLQHPGIVRVFEVGFHDAASFIVMELVHGSTLREWLQTPRTPVEIRDVFVQIARALVAAHAAGIVHRDIKPDNVILSEDGRARVLDFGLAMLERAEASPTPQSGISGDDRITRTGSLVGTPAYMSPEQHIGGTVDHRTDQFSFCVALYEALYGRRPFSGKSLDDVRKATLRGDFAAPRVRGAAAKTIRRVVLRGLESLPDARWPSMQALATQLESKAPRRSLQVAVLAVGGALVAAAAVPLDTRDCDARATLTEAIGEERRGHADAAIRGVGTPYAEAAADAVAEGVAVHGAAWAAAYQAYCEAPPSEEREEVALCLQSDLGRLGAKLDAFARTDAESIYAVVPAIRSLPDPDRCSDPARREAKRPMPRDPTLAAEVVKVREALIRSAAFMETGQYPDAEREAREALRLGEAAGFDPATAEAEHAVAVAVATLGRVDEARPHFQAAFFKASAAGHAALAISAAHSLIRLESKNSLDESAVQHWLDAAEAWIDRMPDPERWRALQAKKRAELHMTRGEYAEAAEVVRPALEQLERTGHLEDVTSARTLLAFALAESDQLEAAVEQQRLVIDETRASYSGLHPDLAGSTANLGFMLLKLGELDEAEHWVNEGIDLYIKTAGPDYPELGNAYGMKADILMTKGNFEEAARVTRRAMEIQEAVFPADHPILERHRERLERASRPAELLAEGRTVLESD